VNTAHPFPRLRWFALVWLAVWIPAYWHTWGPANFLFVCDVAVILSCLGWWSGSALLLSSQAVSSIVLNLLWTVNVAWGVAFGRLLIPGSEYMWDAKFPLAVRLLSLFHVFLPPLLVWSLRRVGYDPRGLPLQCVIAAVVMAASHIVGAGLDPPHNLNFALTDPVFQRQLGPAAVHVALIFFAMIALIYLPTHWALRLWLPTAKKQ
jgi:hypothetical protein